MMNTTITRNILRFSLSVSVLLMVFGIGLTTVSAATPAANNNLQPASGATEFRAEDEDGHATEEEAGIVGMFGINWKLLLAQLVNFAIVVFVLWKWVFKPVTSGLTARTEKIENSLKDAEKITKDRETFDSWKQGEMSTVRIEAAAIITQAKKDAESLKAQTLQTTTEDQNRIIEQAQKRLEQEKAAMLISAKAELADIVVSATSTILKEKIDASKDKNLIDSALKGAQQ